MAGSLFTNYIMCLCKCGQLTERLIVKVSTEIENELGIVIESTVEETALRLRLTIVQAAGSGLTCLILILKAMRIYANFPWWVVAALYGNEMANVETATTAVGDNPYYGFKKDLGAVKSRLYKNIAWVAKELLKPARLDLIQGIIDTYVEHHETRQVDTSTEDSDRVRRIQDQVNGWASIIL
ncbi:hypothetical protein PGB90_001491 [Kerria lacca]